MIWDHDVAGSNPAVKIAWCLVVYVDNTVQYYGSEFGSKPNETLCIDGSMTEWLIVDALKAS